MLSFQLQLERKSSIHLQNGSSFSIQLPKMIPYYHPNNSVHGNSHYRPKSPGPLPNLRPNSSKSSLKACFCANIQEDQLELFMEVDNDVHSDDDKADNVIENDDFDSWDAEYPVCDNGCLPDLDTAHKVLRSTK